MLHHTGRIPSFYREVYSQLSGTEGGRVSRRTWQSLADTASLLPAVLDQVYKYSRMTNCGVEL